MEQHDFFLDTEFIEDGTTIDLISIGVVDNDGRELYLESAEADLSRANEFVVECVIPHLGPVEKRVSRAAIRQGLVGFVGERRPRFIADFGAYDWIAVCQLFGRMIDLPDGWPMFITDFQQLLQERNVWRRAWPNGLGADFFSKDTERSISRASAPKTGGRRLVSHNALDDAIVLRQEWNLVERWSRPASARLMHDERAHPVARLGPELFSFSSHTDWVNKARSRFENCIVHVRDIVCVDSMGRICVIGRDFNRAQVDGSFPVTAYHIDPNWKLPT